MNSNLDYPSDYILPKGSKKTLQPPADSSSVTGANHAVELIRHKLDQLYASEPDAKKELDEAEDQTIKRSKYQQFMHELNQSGKSLAEIQTAWHDYYAALPDHEKHEVWREFNEAYEQTKHHANTSAYVTQPQPAIAEQSIQHRPQPSAHGDSRSTAAIKQQLVGRVQSRRKSKAKQHAHSLVFGLGMGAITLLILLFGFFNERFITPFMTPSRSVSNTPIIIDPSSTATGSEPKIIIPKINVEIPVVYTEPSIEEQAVQRALENGVVHYATTPSPGEIGNGVIFGHSSNNILNKGKYKFAFVLLKRLEPGDTFILQKDGKRYAYKVFEKKVVKPEDLSVLGNSTKPSTFTLITCDPPGTTLNRMVVTGEQISPDPSTNVASKVNQSTAIKPQALPGDAPSLWHRLTSWLTS